MTRREVDAAFSLGSNCLPAAVLRESGFRHCAGAYDWVHTPHLDDVFRLWESGFSDFFAGNLSFLAEKENVSHQILEVRTGIRIRHPYRLNGVLVPLEELSLGFIHRLHQRRWSRMVAIMNHADTVLFFRVEEREPEGYRRLKEQLDRVTPHAKVILLYAMRKQGETCHGNLWDIVPSDVEDVFLAGSYQSFGEASVLTHVRMVTDNFKMSNWIESNRALVDSFAEESK